MEEIITINSKGELKVKSVVEAFYEDFTRTINLADELKAAFNKFVEEDNIIDDR